jgi:hypothetical protein
MNRIYKVGTHNVVLSSSVTEKSVQEATAELAALHGITDENDLMRGKNLAYVNLGDGEMFAIVDESSEEGQAFKSLIN